MPVYDGISCYYGLDGQFIPGNLIYHSRLGINKKLNIQNKSVKCNDNEDLALDILILMI